MMKIVKVVVLETTETHTEPIDHFPLTVPANDSKAAVQTAIKEVESKGYRVIPNNLGGCNELCYVSGGEDYIAITVEPEEEPQN